MWRYHTSKVKGKGPGEDSEVEAWKNARIPRFFQLDSTRFLGQESKTSSRFTKHLEKNCIIFIKLLPFRKIPWHTDIIIIFQGGETSTSSLAKPTCSMKSQRPFRFAGGCKPTSSSWAWRGQQIQRMSLKLPLKIPCSSKHFQKMYIHIHIFAIFENLFVKMYDFLVLQMLCLY